MASPHGLVAPARPEPASRPAAEPSAAPEAPPAAARTAGTPRATTLEHSILLTVTMCLLAAGSVMVYSASSAESLLDGSGDPARFLKRYVVFGVLGLVAMRLCARVSLRSVKRATPGILLAAFVLTIAVKVPGVGVNVNGAARWLAVGPVQFQPSELLKVALVLYAAALLAARPRQACTLGGLLKPLGLVTAAACALVLAQPDMGTALVIGASVAALLVAAGVRLRHLALLAGAAALLVLLLALVE